MSQEQVFEEQPEDLKKITHREWSSISLPDSDLASLVEQQRVTAEVNLRLSEFRRQPPFRFLGNAVTWGGCLALGTVQWLNSANNHAFNILLPTAFCTLLAFNVTLRSLDRANAALKLQDYDVRWVGPLIEALAWPNRRVRDIARLKLLNLLPLLTEAQSKTLNQRRRDSLNRILEECSDIPLMLVVLKALTKVGDATSLPFVSRLTDMSAFTPRHYQVRRAARICLPLLREQCRLQSECSASNELKPGEIGVKDISSLGLENGENLYPLDRRIATIEGKSSLSQLEAEREKVSQPAVRTAFLIADWCIIVPFGAYELITSLEQRHWLFSLGWTAFTALATQLYRISLSPARVAMMRKQVQERDIKAVGALAEALEWPEEDLQYEAGAALTFLLPMLKANNASLLNARQRYSLHKVLNIQNVRLHGDLMLAILHAFEQVGDTAAIPYVVQLAAAKPRNSSEAAVVRAAQECLPFLHLCAGNNSASQSLLRASSQSYSPAGDNLLRPAKESPETKPEQLLRPIMRDDRE